MKKSKKQFFIIIPLVALMYGCSPGGFVKEDLENMKMEITNQYEKNGMKVNEVELIIENSKKVTGYAKLQKFGIDVIAKCWANYGEDGRYIWRCE